MFERFRNWLDRNAEQELEYGNTTLAYSIVERHAADGCIASERQYLAQRISDVLIESHGFHQCSWCSLATEEPDEHLKMLYHPCREEYREHLRTLERELSDCVPQSAAA